MRGYRVGVDGDRGVRARSSWTSAASACEVASTGENRGSQCAPVSREAPLEDAMRERRRRGLPSRRSGHAARSRRCADRARSARTPAQICSSTARTRSVRSPRRRIGARRPPRAIARPKPAKRSTSGGTAAPRRAALRSARAARLRRCARQIQHGNAANQPVGNQRRAGSGAPGWRKTITSTS